MCSFVFYGWLIFWIEERGDVFYWVPGGDVFVHTCMIVPLILSKNKICALKDGRTEFYLAVEPEKNLRFVALESGECVVIPKGKWILTAYVSPKES